MFEALDIIIALTGIGFIVKGVWRGFVKEISGILAITGALVGSFVFQGPIEELLLGFFRPRFVGVFSYLLLFLALYIVLLLIGRLIDRFLKNISLGALNKVLGGFFGLFKALLWTSLCVYAYSTLQKGAGFEHPALVADSIFYPFLLDFVALLEHGL